MKKIKLEGDFVEEIVKQMDQVNAYKNAISTISLAMYTAEKKMWEHLKKEMPDISDNCSLSNENGCVMLIDRLA
jgi:hypothetical protein